MNLLSLENPQRLQNVLTDQFVQLSLASPASVTEVHHTRVVFARNARRQWLSRRETKGVA